MLVIAVRGEDLPTADCHCSLSDGKTQQIFAALVTESDVHVWVAARAAIHTQLRVLVDFPVLLHRCHFGIVRISGAGCIQSCNLLDKLCHYLLLGVDCRSTFLEFLHFVRKQGEPSCRLLLVPPQSSLAWQRQLQLLSAHQQVKFCFQCFNLFQQLSGVVPDDGGFGELQAIDRYGCLFDLPLEDAFLMQQGFLDAYLVIYQLVQLSSLFMCMYELTLQTGVVGHQVLVFSDLLIRFDCLVLDSFSLALVVVNLGEYATKLLFNVRLVRDIPQSCPGRRYVIGNLLGLARLVVLFGQLQASLGGEHLFVLVEILLVLPNCCVVTEFHVLGLREFLRRDVSLTDVFIIEGRRSEVLGVWHVHILGLFGLCEFHTFNADGPCSIFQSLSTKFIQIEGLF